MRDENERKLFRFEHRSKFLKAIELLLKLLQIAGMLVCFSYVLFNYSEMEWQDIPFGTKYATFLIKKDYMDVICFVISILLGFSRPDWLSKQIIALDMAIGYLKASKGGKLPSYKEMAINIAEQYITEVEVAADKKQSKEEIEPHEKRMVFRRRMIIGGIIGLSVLTIVLFFFGWNIPQIASIDLLLGYAMVMIEAYYYQVELKKAGIETFSDSHKAIITTREGRRQRYKCCQKICYMKRDRLLNYCLVLGVATTATNIVSVVVTILDVSGNVDFQKLFALQIKSVNGLVAVFFAIASFVLYAVECVVTKKWQKSIFELGAIMETRYSKANLEELEKQFIVPKTNLFSLLALDKGRGTYDYNNDALVNKYIKHEKIFIPAGCMLTVEDSISGRLPRYKLTALITWLCLFCYFVWAKMDILNIFYVTVAAIAVFDIMVVVNTFRLCRCHKDWLIYEAEMDNGVQAGQRQRKIKKEICQRLSFHAFIIVVLIILRFACKV